MILEMHKKAKQYKITIKNESIALGLASFINKNKIKFSSIVDCYLKYLLHGKTSSDFIYLQRELDYWFNSFLKQPSLLLLAPPKKTYLIRVKSDLDSVLSTYLTFNKTTLSALINGFFNHLLSSEMVENTLNTIFWGSWFKTNVSYSKDKKEVMGITEDRYQKLLNTHDESLTNVQLEEDKKNQNEEDEAAINSERQRSRDVHNNFLRQAFAKETRTQLTSIHFTFSTLYKKNFKADFYKNMKKELLDHIEHLYTPHPDDVYFLICFGLHADIKSHKRKVKSKELPTKAIEEDTLDADNTKSPKFHWTNEYKVSMRFLIVYIGKMRYTLGKNDKNTVSIVSLFDDFDGIYPDKYSDPLLQPYFSKNIFDRIDFSSIQVVKKNTSLLSSALKQYKIPLYPLVKEDLYISVNPKPKSPLSYDKKKGFFVKYDKSKPPMLTHCGFIFSFVDVEKN